MRMTDQYRTIVTGAGWAERRQSGRLRIGGADAVSFLQALLSNDVARLRPGGGVYATYLTPQGRMIADLTVYHRGETLIAEVPARVVEALASKLDLSIFSERVTVENLSDTLGELLVVGHAAPGALADALAMPVTPFVELTENEHVTSPDPEIWIARSGDAVAPSFRLFVPSDRAAELVSKLERSGARAISDEVVRTLRVEAGRPEFGADMGEETIPLEAGILERAISTSKGCYVGQEVIIRILHRGGGRVVRRLMTFAIDGDRLDEVAPGHGLVRDGVEVGRLTTVAPASSGTGLVALGYVHRDAAEVGVRLDLRDASGVAEITGAAR